MSISMSVTELVTTTSIAGGPWEYGGPPGFWPISPIAWSLVLVTLAVAGFLVLRRHRAEAPRRAGEARLAEKYAAGEIDAEEYRTRLGVLRNR
jgi:putative membrane protein